MAIFITSVSGSEILASFINRTFHFSRPPGFRMAFDAAERNRKFGRIQCQRSKESSSRAKRKRRVFLCRRTVKVKVERKVILVSCLKRKGDACWRKRLGREKQLEDLVSNQNPDPEAPTRCKKEQERREQRKCQERSDGEGWVCQGH